MRFLQLILILLTISIATSPISGEEIKSESEQTDGINPEPVVFRLISKKSNGEKTTKAQFNVSREFIDFLNEDPSVILSKTYNSGGGCFRRCTDTLVYLRKLQYYYDASSLFSVYYYLSTSRNCFCYDNGYYSSGNGGFFSGGGSFEFDIEIEVDFDAGYNNGGYNDNYGGYNNGGYNNGGGGGGYDNNGSGWNGYKKTDQAVGDTRSPATGAVLKPQVVVGGGGQGQRSCQFQNLFYWIIKLIHSEQYSLRKPVNLERICESLICNNNF